MVLAIVCAHATSAAFTRLERRGPLYYVDGNALTNGDGSESRPFNTLAAVPSEPDSTIYLAGRLRESVEWTGNRDGSALRQWEGRPQAELRGDVVVPPVQWRAESATLWSTSISAAPASVVWNWDENIDEHGRHFGHLPLAASQQACESAEAGWYFDEPNFVLYVNPPPGAANPDAGDTYAWVRRGSGLTIRNGRDFTIDRLVVRLWSDPTPNNGYGIKLSDAVNFTISNCLAEDCGYHSIGFVGSTCERNRLVACVGRGLHGRSNHFVFYSNGGNITKCEAVDCEAHLYSILAWDGRKLEGEDRTGGYFTHTGGDATIDDIEFRSCSALGYTGFVGNAFGVGVTTRTTSDSRNAFTYPVRFVACRAVNCDYVNVAGHVAFVRCRLDFRKAAQSGGNSASTFVFNRSPTQVLIESSEIITRLDGVLVSRAIWPKNAGDVLLLLGNTFFDDGAERGTRSFVRVNETNQIVAEQCVFASQQAMHLTDGAADVSAENLAFANCWYYGIGPEWYSAATELNEREEWEVLVDPAGSYEQPPDLVDPPTDLAPALNGALWCGRTVATGVERLGYNDLPYDGRIGAHQYGWPMARLMAQPCPDGGIFSLEWQRASPQQRVALLYAPERGLTRVPPGRVCGGLMLNLSGGPLTLIGVFRSDVEGAGSLSGLMQPHSCGGHLQFIDLHGCTSTNVLRLE